MRKLLTIALLMMTVGHILAQHDKSVADQMVWQMLTEMNNTENWHADMVIRKNRLRKTAEEGIYVVCGESFQIPSLRSDFYVRQENGEWVAVDDARYPMETMVNLLQNRIADNRHLLKLRHHQYGGDIPTIVLPMQNIFDLFARQMDLYSSVTFIDEKEIRATLVLHQRRLNYIHMLTLKTSPLEFADAGSTISADLYTNIPQGNLNDIFKDKTTIKKQ